MNIDINLTSVCNYGCLYCSEGKNPCVPDKSRILNSKTKVTIDDIDRLVLSVQKKNKDEAFTFGFWGGEPFINWDFAKKLMLHFKYNNNISFIFYSNGYYIKKYINEIVEIDKILGYKLSDNRKRLFIQISYDGKAVNDIERLTKNGKSTSDTCVQAWKLLKNNGIETKFKSTITPRTFKYMYDAFVEFVNLGSNYFPTPDSFSDYDFENEEQYFKDLTISLMKIAKYIYDNKLQPSLFSWFTNSRALCNAGINYFAIDLDGEITPCHSTMYDSFLDHRICNIRDILLCEKLNTASVKYKDLLQYMNDECKNCNALYCLKCPAGNYNLPSNLKRINKDENQYMQRWTKKNINMCKVFKINDAVHKALLKVLKI